MKFLFIIATLFSSLAFATSPKENCFVDKNLKMLIYGEAPKIRAEITFEYDTYMSYAKKEEKFTVDLTLSPSGSNNQLAKVYIAHFSNNDTHSLYERKLVGVTTRYIERLSASVENLLYTENEMPRVYSAGQDRIFAPVVCYQFAD